LISGAPSVLPSLYPSQFSRYPRIVVGGLIAGCLLFLVEGMVRALDRPEKQSASLAPQAQANATGNRMTVHVHPSPVPAPPSQSHIPADNVLPRPQFDISLTRGLVEVGETVVHFVESGGAQSRRWRRFGVAPSGTDTRGHVTRVDVHTGRSEFRGSWFIRYRSSKKTPELEKDFELFFGSDPKQPGAQLPSKHVEKWKKLKDALENTKAFLAVGTLLVGTVVALYEFTDKVHKTLDHTPAPTLSNPAPQSDKRLQKITLPATLVRIDAEKSPGQFERTLNSHVESNLTSRGFLKEKGSSTDTHLEQ
jgi:hypothetical protein